MIILQVEKMSFKRNLSTLDTENISLIYSEYRFKPSSLLSHFVAMKRGFNKERFTLWDILTMLKDIIKQEKPFDQQNPSIIVCSEDLERAIDRKALHVSEFRDRVLIHLLQLEDDTSLTDHCWGQGPGQGQSLTRTVASAARRCIHEANISTNRMVDREARFSCKEKLLSVVRTLNNVDKNKTVFTYGEIMKLVCTYILDNKLRLFDRRNVQVAIVKDDLLGDALAVNYFHRCQLHNLMMGQLVPINSDESMDRLEVIAFGTPGCRVTIKCRGKEQ